MLKSATEKLQRVMNAAARLIINNSDVWLYGLTYMWRHVLHWLDVSDRILNSVCASLSTRGCVHRMAPGYLPELCLPVSALQGRRHHWHYVIFGHFNRSRYYYCSLHRSDRGDWKCRTGKWRTGKWRTKVQGWKMQDWKMTDKSAIHRTR